MVRIASSAARAASDDAGWRPWPAALLAAGGALVLYVLVPLFAIGTDWGLVNYDDPYLVAAENPAIGKGLFGGLGGVWCLRKTGLGRPMFLFWIMLLLAPINVAYRLVPPDTLWFWLGVFIGFFQLGCFYGPTFSSVQELVPPQIRATVVAFYILMLNLVGLGFGITAGGYCIDAMLEAGVQQPYTWTLVVFTLISLLAVPLFFAAGRRFEHDRAHLEALEAARG